MASDRRQRRSELAAERSAEKTQFERRANRQLGTEGERPPGPFGGMPVSEIAIFLGGIGTVVGFVSSAAPALIAGLVVMALGVFEVTAREHFSGFRSHSSLLAAFPAAIVATVVAILAQPRQRAVVLLAFLPVYGVVFWLLRKRFLRARQARVARPPRV